EREEAAAKLKKLGKQSRIALEKAKKDADPEMASRAAHLLRVITVMEMLTPSLLKEIPGIEEQLASEDEHDWTRALLRAFGPNGALSYPGLGRSDWEPIAASAVRGAMDSEELISVCRVLKQLVLSSASKELMELLKHGNADFRREAVDTLGRVGIPEAVPGLRQLLQDSADKVRSKARK